MSLANTLVVAFSQSLLAAAPLERINAVQSVLLLLQREQSNAVAATKGLSPFLRPEFYLVADTKRALFHEGEEAQIGIGHHGLRELGYILTGEVARLELNDEQQSVIRDLGFELRSQTPEPVAYA